MGPQAAEGKGGEDEEGGGGVVGAKVCFGYVAIVHLLLPLVD